MKALFLALQSFQELVAGDEMKNNEYTNCNEFFFLGFLLSRFLDKELIAICIFIIFHFITIVQSYQSSHLCF